MKYYSAEFIHAEILALEKLWKRLLTESQNLMSTSFTRELVDAKIRNLLPTTAPTNGRSE